MMIFASSLASEVPAWLDNLATLGIFVGVGLIAFGLIYNKVKGGSKKAE